MLVLMLSQTEQFLLEVLDDITLFTKFKYYPKLTSIKLGVSLL